MSLRCPFCGLIIVWVTSDMWAVPEHAADSPDESFICPGCQERFARQDAELMELDAESGIEARS